MSLKLFNGYMLKSTSIKDIQDFKDELNARLLPAMEDKYNKIFSYFIVNTVDRLMQLDMGYVQHKEPKFIKDFLENLYRQFNPVGYVLIDFKKQDEMYNEDDMKQMFSLFGMKHIANNYIEFNERFCELTLKRSVPFNYDQNICIFPLEDKTLFLAYGDELENELRRILDSDEIADVEFRNKFGLSEYGYWNNTDKPEELTDAEWSERGKIWAIAIGDDYIPANHGISFLVFSGERFIQGKELGDNDGKWLKEVPSIQERAERLVHDTKQASYVSKCAIKEFGSESEADSSYITEKCHEFNKKYKTLYKEEIEVFVNALPVIDMETLKKTVFEFCPNFYQDYK